MREENKNWFRFQPNYIGDFRLNEEKKKKPERRKEKLCAIWKKNFFFWERGKKLCAIWKEKKTLREKRTKKKNWERMKKNWERMKNEKKKSKKYREWNNQENKDVYRKRCEKRMVFLGNFTRYF